MKSNGTRALVGILIAVVAVAALYYSSRDFASEGGESAVEHATRPAAPQAGPDVEPAGRGDVAEDELSPADEEVSAPAPESPLTEATPASLPSEQLSSEELERLKLTDYNAYLRTRRPVEDPELSPEERRKRALEAVKDRLREKLQNSN